MRLSPRLEELRTLFEDGTRRRLEKQDVRWLHTGGPDTRYNIPYGQDTVWNTFDLHYPMTKRDSLLPVIVNVHGGGWIYGTKEDYRYYCRMLSSFGFAVINMNYRLAPEYPFPAQEEDLNTLMWWLSEHGAEYGLDGSRVYGVGDSAGAQILASHAAMCTNPAYAALFPFEVPANPWKALVLNSGVYYARQKRADFITILTGEYLGLKGRTEEEQEALIRQYEFAAFLTPEFPPVYLMTAEDDYAKLHSAELVRELTMQSVPVTYQLWRGSKVKLGHTFHADLTLEEAMLCNGEEMRFLQNRK